MKKKLISLLLVLVMPMLVLCGCSCGVNTNSSFSPVGTEYKVGDTVLVKVSDGDSFCIFVDKETRVMYLANTEAYRYGLTVMVNADGTPMLYEGEL